MFSPGVWWSGLRLNLCGSFVQSLQMNSYGVGVLRRLQCVLKNSQCVSKNSQTPNWSSTDFSSRHDRVAITITTYLIEQVRRAIYVLMMRP